MSHHRLVASNLTHTYPDGTVALQDVSLRVDHGEAVAIVGANGAGKSTLLLHLNGSLQASAGQIIVGDTLLQKATLPVIRRTLGMVFQDPDDQLFMPTVFDDVAFGPVNLGLASEDVTTRVETALKHVAALALRDKAPYHLSSGEKKRVAIATVLAMMPDILVLDEPTNGLDPKSRRDLIGLLKAFHHTRIITSHDLDMVLEVCPRTIVLHQGRVMADGPTPEIFKNADLLATCRLEKPFAMQSCPVCSPGAETASPIPPLVAPHPGTPHDHNR
ncbi:MAG: ABC transporter ATP-binding protein [Desulfuromonadales bacterium]